MALTSSETVVEVPEGSLIVKRPSASVVALNLSESIVTIAPGSDNPSSRVVTTPVRTISCAAETEGKAKAATKARVRCFMSRSLKALLIGVVVRDNTPTTGSLPQDVS